MKNLKFLAMFFVAALAFVACESSGNEDEGDGVFRLSVSPKMILADGEHAAVFDARVGNKKVTNGVIFFDTDNNEVSMPGMKFTTTTPGTYTFWAMYGDQFSEEVTITAVEELPAAGDLPEDPNPGSTSFERKVMLIKFTGTGCGWCPQMTDRLHSMPAALSKKCVLTEAHCYNEDDPMYLWSAALHNTMAVGGFPTLGVDFHSTTAAYSSQGLVNSLVQDAVDREDAKAGIAVCASYNSVTRMVAIKAEVKAAVTANYRIGAWLLEDGISATQSNNGGTIGSDYDTHNNAVRIADSKVTNSDYTGYYLGEIQAGEKMQFEFNPLKMEVEESWNADNCHVVVFITTESSEPNELGQTWFVNNVVDCQLNGTVAYQYK